MARGTYEEAAALQALIQSNLRLLYPSQKTEVVTYDGEGNNVYACVVCIRSDGEPDILVQGNPGDNHAYALLNSALEQVYYKTMQLLGEKFKKTNAQ
ncbi:hypothetical protein CDEST_02041 [Colletotrichum destructivum]|uniref:Uncharacterized protein n=1 Tax=Colletotrichum destructivum TaxID=34406 RepID=A0AAX4I1N7_9PEZI|nr:hypothetical protein CDEST_02041 [Colletotrichum destructivum]